MVNDSSITNNIIELTTIKDIPAHSLAIMRLSLLDWLSVSIAGTNEPVSRLVRDFVFNEGGNPQATVFGISDKLPTRAAALINGTTSHALDYDDTHFIHIGHPSVAILPATFAIAEMIGADRQAILEAALIGCEASCRIGAWLGRQHYQHGFHQTATSGTFGATVAASRLLGLSKVQIAHALGLASTRASGLKSQFGTMGKPFHAGMAASNGVEAALLTQAGFISQPDGLEGEQGFGSTHTGENNPWIEPSASFLFDSVQHKFHACCHGTHATLEALDKLQTLDVIDLDQIAQIEITVHPRWLTVCNILAPTTGLEAKFSYRLTTAAKLAGYNTAALDTFCDELCTTPKVTVLRDIVEIITDDLLPETASRVAIQLKSGKTITEVYDLNQLPDYPMREEKLLAKAASLIGPKRAKRIWDCITSPKMHSTPFDLQTLQDA